MNVKKFRAWLGSMATSTGTFARPPASGGFGATKVSVGG